MSKARQFSPEVRGPAVCLVREQTKNHDSQCSQLATITAIAPKLGCTAETLRRWVREDERDAGERPGLPSDQEARLKALERENRGLRRASKILRKTSAYCAQTEIDSRTPDVRVHGRAEGHVRRRADLPGLEIASSGYDAHRVSLANPTRQSAPAQRHEVLREEISCVWDAQHQVYGARKVWRQLWREGTPIEVGTNSLGGVDPIEHVLDFVVKQRRTKSR